jgi:hypothetical protein
VAIRTAAFTALSTLAALVAACDATAEDSRDMVVVYVEAPQVAESGDPIPLRLVVENHSGKPVELHGAAHYQRYGFTVTDTTGKEVWRTRPGEVIDLISTRWTIAAAQTIEHEETWNQIGNDGHTVRPGTYFIRAFMRGGIEAKDSKTMSDPIEIRILP